MTAANDDDQLRIDLEDAMGPLALLMENLRRLQIKLENWARTDYEADMLREIREGKRELEIAQRVLSKIHPNGRGEE